MKFDFDGICAPYSSVMVLCQDEYDDTYEDLGGAQAQDATNEDLQAKIIRPKFVKGNPVVAAPVNPYVRQLGEIDDFPLICLSGNRAKSKPSQPLSSG